MYVSRKLTYMLPSKYVPHAQTFQLFIPTAEEIGMSYKRGNVNIHDVILPRIAETCKCTVQLT